jgi:hypothetical protein
MPTKRLPPATADTPAHRMRFAAVIFMVVSLIQVLAALGSFACVPCQDGVDDGQAHRSAAEDDVALDRRAHSTAACASIRP